MSLTIKELAERVGAEYRGDGDAVIDAAAPITTAGPGQVSFLSNPAYKKYLHESRASLLVVSPDSTVDHTNVIVCENPYLTFSEIVDILYPSPYPENWTIHPTAAVAASATIADRVEIGPQVVIEDDVVVGTGTVIKGGTFVGLKSVIGENCLIAPNVSIMHETTIGNNVIIHAGTVIGADGFGFAPTAPGKEFKKIRQVGWVEIGDNVELGANVTIDRGAIGPTVIERGVKVDNLVQVGHNVRVGENSIIVSQVGISGSTKLGKSVVLAGQVGVTGHLDIGDGAMVGAQSGVASNLESGGRYFGSPARPQMEAMRIEAVIRQLPDIFKRLKQLEKSK